MVQVVSIDDVPMMFGSVSFQSNEVSGAQNSYREGAPLRSGCAAAAAEAQAAGGSPCSCCC